MQKSNDALNTVQHSGPPQQYYNLGIKCDLRDLKVTSFTAHKS